MENRRCYIDKAPCFGVRFSFCDDCKKARLENGNQIQNEKTPVELTAAHVPADKP